MNGLQHFAVQLFIIWEVFINGAPAESFRRTLRHALLLMGPCAGAELRRGRPGPWPAQEFDKKSFYYQSSQPSPLAHARTGYPPIGHRLLVSRTLHAQAHSRLPQFPILSVPDSCRLQPRRRRLPTWTGNTVHRSAPPAISRSNRHGNARRDLASPLPCSLLPPIIRTLTQVVGKGK